MAIIFKIRSILINSSITSCSRKINLKEVYFLTKKLYFEMLEEDYFCFRMIYSLLPENMLCMWAEQCLVIKRGLETLFFPRFFFQDQSLKNSKIFLKIITLSL